MNDENATALIAAIGRLAAAVEAMRPQQQQQAFVPRPAPEEPEGACPEHGTAWRLVPAGVSKKTGNKYNAFWACSTQGCNIKPGQVVESLAF